MHLIFDTETTGIVDYKLPAIDSRHPRLVAICASLYDDARIARGYYSVIVKPDGFDIPAEAYAVHGITTEIANRYGIPLKVALPMFTNILRLAKVTVAHNWEYDHSVIASELQRLGQPDHFEGIQKFCTKLTMTPVCKIPAPAWKVARNPEDPFKWPSLEEAFTYAFNESPPRVHSAGGDVASTTRLYWWILDRIKGQNLLLPNQSNLI